MLDIEPVRKDAEQELRVPSIWRGTLAEIVEAFRDGDYCLQRRIIPGVSKIDERTAEIIAGNIAYYPCVLASLPPETWKTSVYLWMEDYWEVIVDLYSVDTGCTDLILDVRVYEEPTSYRFDVQLVYVP